jgi:hypothetical protein
MRKIFTIILAANIVAILMGSNLIPTHCTVTGTDNVVYVDKTYITICGQQIVLKDNLE